MSHHNDNLANPVLGKAMFRLSFCEFVACTPTGLEARANLKTFELLIAHLIFFVQKKLEDLLRVRVLVEPSLPPYKKPYLSQGMALKLQFLDSQHPYIVDLPQDELLILLWSSRKQKGLRLIMQNQSMPF